MWASAPTARRLKAARADVGIGTTAGRTVREVRSVEINGNNTERLQKDVGGLRAVEMFYRGIREIETGSVAFFQSRTRLNTPGLGTLIPENFREVAELSNQCLTLFDLELAQGLEAERTFRERDFFFQWISVYMPIRFLLEKGAESKLIRRMEAVGLDTNRMCFELPAKLLTEGSIHHARAIANLRNRGFHFLLTGFGGNNSPLMKLSDFPVDYVMLSQEIISYLGKTDRAASAVKSIVEFVSQLGAEPIADGVANAAQAEALYEAQCRYISGSLAGKYTLERYIRKRSEGYLKSEEDAPPEDEEGVESED